MRIIEDIVRVEKGSKRDLPKSFSVAKKTVAPRRSRKKAPVKNVKSKIKKRTIKSGNLVSKDGRLILKMIVILFIFIFFIGLFLYDDKKDIPPSIENTITELEREDELLKKEIDELEEFYTGELLEDTIKKIEKMQD